MRMWALSPKNIKLNLCVRLFACAWYPPLKRLGEMAVMVSVALPWALQARRSDDELMGWLGNMYMCTFRT